MKRTRLALALLLALALPAAAYEHHDDHGDAAEGYQTFYLGDGLWQVRMNVFALAAGEKREIYISLRDVPGPIYPGVELYIKPLSEGASRTELSMDKMSFAAGLPGHYAAHVIVVVRNESGHEETYRLKAVVRGRE